VVLKEDSSGFQRGGVLWYANGVGLARDLRGCVTSRSGNVIVRIQPARALETRILSQTKHYLPN